MPDKETKKKGEDQLDQRTEALLQTMRETQIEKDDVVSMIENLVGKLGQIGQQAIAPPPAPSVSPIPEAALKREPSRQARQILTKLESAQQADNHACLRQDEEFIAWLNKTGCKLKHYSDELECCREITEFAGAHGLHDLAILAVRKAIAITRLHNNRETEMLSEFYWALAELYATTDNMKEAQESLRNCVSYLDAEAGEDSPTYRELWSQLEEIRSGSLITV